MAAPIPSRSWSGRSSAGGIRDGTGASAIFSQPLARTTDPERSTMTTAAPTFSISSVLALAAREAPSCLEVRVFALAFFPDDFFAMRAFLSLPRCGRVPTHDGSLDNIGNFVFVARIERCAKVLTRRGRGSVQGGDGPGACPVMGPAPRSRRRGRGAG